MFKQVLVAVDGSPTANRGLRTAIDLAADQKAALAIVHVIDDMTSVSYVGDMGYVPGTFIDRVLDDLRANGRRILDKASALAKNAGVDARQVLVEAKGGSIADAILAQVRKVRADVIVLGTHGRRGLRRMVMGSDAEAIVRDARVPVLLVRGNDRASAPSGMKRAASKARAGA